MSYEANRVNVGFMEQEKGTAPPSYVATQLDALAREGVATQEDLDDIKGTSSTIYAGATHHHDRPPSTNYMPLAGMETVCFLPVARLAF